MRAMTLAVFFVALSLGFAGCNRVKNTETKSAVAAVSADGPWKFLVYGDSRGDGTNFVVADQVNIQILSELVVATTNEKPAFVLFPGDLVNHGNVQTLMQWVGIMQPVYNAGIAVYPVFGNHDDDGGEPDAFVNVFSNCVPANGPVGERYRTYAVGYRNALVLAVDCYTTDSGGFNASWAKAVLATNTLPHVFAFTHKPAFGTDKDKHDGLDNYGKIEGQRDTFWKALEGAGARAFFAGHIHAYDHARLDNGDGNPSNDVHQYVVATAGAPLAAKEGYTTHRGSWTPQKVMHEMQYGYVVVEVNGPDVTITWKHRTAPGVYEATADVFSYRVPPRPSAQ